MREEGGRDAGLSDVPRSHDGTRNSIISENETLGFLRKSSWMQRINQQHANFFFMNICRGLYERCSQPNPKCIAVCHGGEAIFNFPVLVFLSIIYLPNYESKMSMLDLLVKYLCDGVSKALEVINNESSKIIPSVFSELPSSVFGVTSYRGAATIIVYDKLTNNRVFETRDYYVFYGRIPKLTIVDPGPASINMPLVALLHVSEPTRLFLIGWTIFLDCSKLETAFKDRGEKAVAKMTRYIFGIEVIYLRHFLGAQLRTRNRLGHYYARASVAFHSPRAFWDVSVPMWLGEVCSGDEVHRRRRVQSRVKTVASHLVYLSWCYHVANDSAPSPQEKGGGLRLCPLGKEPADGAAHKR